MSLPLPEQYLELGDINDDALREFAAQVQRNFERIARAIVLPERLILTGDGDPNGAVEASPPCLWLRRDGGAGTTLYVKESGVNTDTGWVAK